ncbi:DUF3817 domain-containing protein [Burkholderia sp. 22PA0099]|uniref:DUF3817 domain-containing protein n=1 Tax=Burkholderia sp. 22PA0099 TaxID=3237372 RepID=UPI0039C4D175
MHSHPNVRPRDRHAPSFPLDALRRLRISCIAEGITLLLLLCVAVPLKHLAGANWAVHLMGPVHGLTFLVHGWLALRTASEANWRGTDTAALLGLALVPFGGFVNAARLSRRIDAQRAEAAR